MKKENKPTVPVSTDFTGAEHLLYKYVMPKDVRDGTGSLSLARSFAKMRYERTWRGVFTAGSGAMTAGFIGAAIIFSGLAQDAAAVAAFLSFGLTRYCKHQHELRTQDMTMLLDELDDDDDDTSLALMGVLLATADRLASEGKDYIVVKEKGLPERLLIDTATLHVMPKSYYPTYKKHGLNTPALVAA